MAKTAKKLPFDDLSILPGVVASQVLAEVYTGQEVSDHARSPKQVASIERIRQQLNPGQRLQFETATELRCRKAYACDAPWIIKIMNSNSNAGRDMLYQFVRHWLAAYCLYPDKFVRETWGGQTLDELHTPPCEPAESTPERLAVVAEIVLEAATQEELTAFVASLQELLGSYGYPAASVIRPVRLEKHHVAH
jgi:hypothetical protein